MVDKVVVRSTVAAFPLKSDPLLLATRDASSYNPSNCSIASRTDARTSAVLPT